MGVGQASGGQFHFPFHCSPRACTRNMLSQVPATEQRAPHFGVCICICMWWKQTPHEASRPMPLAETKRCPGASPNPEAREL